MNPSGLVTEKFQMPPTNVMGVDQPWLLDTVPVHPEGSHVLATTQTLSGSPSAPE
uniref:Uncharacterized protein n=1 Tax=Mycolicibacterium neoaurum VKM Ac-1815D TaxID=700508 RepID=V5XIW9_MYCNE